MFLPLRSLALPQRGGALILAAAAFAVGLSTGAVLAPNVAANNAAIPRTTVEAAPNKPLRNGYSADVTRVLDGDTFEARVKIWLGQEVTTRIRLRGIDAPEMKARCDIEHTKALAAKDYLARLLNEGGVTVTQIGQDKYGGRVDADASTARTSDVGSALLAAGLARPYNGGKRQSWCD
jgi:micrococcal nuclease